MDKRAAFWKYCIQTAGGARSRARAKGVPFSIDSNFIDRMLVDQRWCCAISQIPFSPPRRRAGKDPFSPSLDRIIPSLGYVPGNLRVVCNLVNSAMMDWGLEAFLTAVEVMAQDIPRTKRKWLRPHGAQKPKFHNDFNGT